MQKETNKQKPTNTKPKTTTAQPQIIMCLQPFILNMENRPFVHCYSQWHHLCGPCTER